MRTNANLTAATLIIIATVNMKKILLILLLFSFGASAQQWTLVNNTLTIQIKKNTSTPVQVGKWLSNFAIIGDSVSVIYQRNQDNSHFTYYIDKDSVISPVMVSATALYDTLVKWTVGVSTAIDTTSLSNRINLKVDSIDRKPGTDSVFYYTNGTAHFAYIDSVSASTIAAAAWSLTGNASTVPGTNFIGTTDSAAWQWKTNNRQWWELQVKGQLWGRAGLGTFAYDTTNINSEQLQTSNLAVGDSSMKNLRFGPDTAIAHNNTAFGFWALRNLINGWGNTAIGCGSQAYTIGEWGSSLHNAGSPYGSGYENTSVGFLTMHLNRHGYENTAIGTGTLFKNNSPKDNVAIGVGVLSSSIDTVLGSTGVGTFALRSYTTSSGAGGNTAIGGQAMQETTVGYGNVAVGGRAMLFNTSGFSNVAIGQDAGNANTTGSGNVWAGIGAGISNVGSHCIFIGSRSGANMTSATGLVLIGFGAFNNTATDDTTKTPIYIKTNSGGGSVDSSTTVGEFNGKWRVNDGTNTVIAQRPYLANINGLQLWSTVVNDTTSGDAATINSVVGRFKKDDSGSTFTLTNSFITTNSAITLTANNAAVDATATSWTYFVGTPGVATIVFNSAPTADFKMIFKVEN